RYDLLYRLDLLLDAHRIEQFGQLLFRWLLIGGNHRRRSRSLRRFRRRRRRLRFCRQAGQSQSNSQCSHDPKCHEFPRSLHNPSYSLLPCCLVATARHLFHINALRRYLISCAAPFCGLSLIAFTFDINCLISIPLSASKSAGTCAAMRVMSPVILYAPAASSLPVETIVIWSTFDSGSAIARTTSAMFVSSLSTTAAWFHSW